MGVVYKVKPEIRDQVLKEKKDNPALSCRGLVDLVKTKYKIRISKSSVNAIIKDAGMSRPVGRRQVRVKRPIIMPPLPNIEINNELRLKEIPKPAIEQKPEIPKAEIEVPLGPAIITPPSRESLPTPPIIPLEAPAAQEEITPIKIEEPAEKPVEKTEPTLELITPKPQPEESAVLPQAPEEKIIEPIPEPIAPEVLPEAEVVAQAKPEEKIEPAEKSEALSEPVVLKPPVEEKSESPTESKAEEPPIESPQEVVPEKIIEPVLEPITPEALPEAEIAAQAKPEEKITEATPEPPIKKINFPTFGSDLEIPEESISTGAILLRAADSLLGGSYYFAQAVGNRLGKPFETQDVSRIEGLLYTCLLEMSEEKQKDFNSIWSLIGAQFALDDLITYRLDLAESKEITKDIYKIINNNFREVRYLKYVLSDESIYYLDGQLYSAWSIPNTPYDFSAPIYSVKKYIEQYLFNREPFIFSMAPGYELPNKELFDLVASFSATTKKISRISLYGNKSEELEVIPVEQNPRRQVIFGFWPWQYSNCRKVKAIGEFKPFQSKIIKEQLYIADMEIEFSLAQPAQSVTLRGFAVKKNLAEKIKIVVLSNLEAGSNNSENILDQYFNRWPNLDEAFRDYSRKIELFTYTATSQSYFNPEALNLNQDAAGDLKALFGAYVKILDSYVKWHFLPSGSEKKDFNSLNASFYKLKVTLKRQKERILADFQLPAGYALVKDLEYCLRRVNEKNIYLDGKKLVLGISR